MEEDQPKPSIKDRIRPNLRSAAKYTIAGVIGGVVVYAFDKHRTIITVYPLTMDNITKLYEQGQGVIGFGHGGKRPVYFALPDKV